MRVLGKSPNDSNVYIVELSAAELEEMQESRYSDCYDCPECSECLLHPPEDEKTIAEITNTEPPNLNEEAFKKMLQDGILDSYNSGDIDEKEMKRSLKEL